MGKINKKGIAVLIALIAAGAGLLCWKKYRDEEYL